MSSIKSEIVYNFMSPSRTMVLQRIYLKVYDRYDTAFFVSNCINESQLQGSSDVLIPPNVWRENFNLDRQAVERCTFNSMGVIETRLENDADGNPMFVHKVDREKWASLVLDYLEAQGFSYDEE